MSTSVEITDDRDAAAQRLANQFDLTPEEILGSPTVLIGTPDQIAETLMERRERFGFSYITVLEAVYEEFAPVVERLAGR
jgi:alkanesulfonate monooxygenase SsuD/methylene tetrahydromethanopterin reductase-like flavin-dependent oxidoreductase (luciferase family)